MGEIWKLIIIDGEVTNYEASSSGLIRNKRTLKILKPYSIIVFIASVLFVSLFMGVLGALSHCCFLVIVSQKIFGVMIWGSAP